MVQAVDITGYQITEDGEIKLNGIRPTFFNSGNVPVRIFFTVIAPGGTFTLDMGNLLVHTICPIKFMTAGYPTPGPRLDLYYGTLK